MSDATGNSRSGSGRDGPGRWPAVRLTLLVVGCALVAGATAAALLTDDPRWLKGAVLAAGWACALALIAGARPRPESEWSHERVQELRRSYELEVEREVAARREYELQLEVRMRREMDAEMAAKVAALRTEIGTLRQDLTDASAGSMSVRRVEMRETTMTTDTVDAADTVVGMAPISIPSPRREHFVGELLGQHGGASWEPDPPRRFGSPAGTVGPANAPEPPALELAADPLRDDPGEPHFDRADDHSPSFDAPPDYAYRFEPERESPSGRHSTPADPDIRPGQPPSTGRRRRRYREDHEENEVLNRVMRER
ncbi:MAG TPA: DUF6779 domain-containing protein [Mycobacteriales bacterium]|nr:DUF6779 domain-containing protein [Mycobacteriales bacterium]